MNKFLFAMITILVAGTFGCSSQEKKFSEEGYDGRGRDNLNVYLEQKAELEAEKAELERGYEAQRQARQAAELEQLYAPLTLETAPAVYQKAHADWRNCLQRIGNDGRLHYDCDEHEIALAFGRVMIVHPEVEVDFRDVWTRSQKEFGNSNYRVIWALITEYNLPTDRFRWYLENERESLLAELREGGFDPTKSHLNKTWRSHNPMSANAEELTRMGWLCNQLGLLELEVLWTRHLADHHYMTGDLDSAAVLYRKIGDERSASEAETRGARESGNHWLACFTHGSNYQGYYNPSCRDCPPPRPPFEVEYLEWAKEAFDRGRIDGSNQLREAGQAAESAGRLLAAKRAYELAGDEPDVKRMALLSGN